VCGVWCVVCGLWYVVYDMCVVCGMWCVWCARQVCFLRMRCVVRGMWVVCRPVDTPVVVAVGVALFFPHDYCKTILALTCVCL